MRLLALVVVLALSGCTHTVTVHSIPEGATVVVDGKPAGVTPCKIEASTGEPIWVRLEGYYPRQFFLKDSPSTVGMAGNVAYSNFDGGVKDTYSIRLEPDPDAKK